VSHLTHPNYAFASIVSNSGQYSCQLLKDTATLTADFRGFKTSNPELKILARWEEPASADQLNLTNLMTAFRDDLPLNGLLTAAVGMGPANNRRPAQNSTIPFSDVLDTVDFFNVMTYQVYSTNETTFPAPLFAPNIKPYGTYNGIVDGTITDLLVNRHVPAGKLVLGIPFYGVSYPSVPAEGPNFGLYEPPALETVPNPEAPTETETVYALPVPYNQIAAQVSDPTPECSSRPSTRSL
jgi:GH18 family chitinase